MTAEERLNRAFAAAYGDPNHVLAPVVTEMMHLASAIRAAENEALERAARSVLVASHYPYITANQHERELLADWIADRIRSLKSKPPEGK